jgi:hypothetical protein
MTKKWVNAVLGHNRDYSVVWSDTVVCMSRMRQPQTSAPINGAFEFETQGYYEQRNKTHEQISGKEQSASFCEKSRLAFVGTRQQLSRDRYRTDTQIASYMTAELTL